MKQSRCHVLLAAVVLFVGLSTCVAAGRHPTAARLLQQDALSNSNGCLATIPKCEPGACVARNVMGMSTWVCLRCLANYAPVVTSDGQDNIVQCVCPKGWYEEDANASSCTKCPANAFCQGGDQSPNPVSRGTNTTCGGGLITRTTGARSKPTAWPPAGYAMTSTRTATACNPSEYAPIYNRLAKCLRCQSGLAESPSSGLTDGQRTNKLLVCKVPPGKYMSQGLVRTCPQGFYRANYTDFNAAVSQICLACNPGITTAGAGARSASECTIVIPGYGLSLVNNAGGIQQPIPPLPPASNTTGLAPAYVCALGYYSSGGYCAQCPANTVTRSPGAQSVEECVVPPGYVITGGVMTQCQAGEFREGWVMYADPKSRNCTKCGDSITSEARDVDENPLAANTSLVRGTSFSCYIEAGQGMIASGRNTFVGKDCPANTYGAAGRVYGWASAPCKPCPRNMITDNATKVNNSDACINPDGFGYASEGASRCAPGFYSAKGSRKPCQQCASGRTTADLPSAQRVVADCFVKPGFGVVNSTANSTNAFNPDTTGFSNASLLAMPVLECPVGFYSAGNSLGAECAACPDGSTTADSGATNIANCTVCQPGYGIPVGGSACALCPKGFFQAGGNSQCDACPTTTFYTPVDGAPVATSNYTSAGITLYLGSYTADACVPVQSQLSPEAGQAYFSPTAAIQGVVTNSTATSLGACIATCAPSLFCMTQFDSNASSCKTATLPLATSTVAGDQLVIKLPPATLTSASSVKDPVARAKMMSSGYYGHGALPSDTTQRTAWNSVGSPLGPDARTFASAAAWDPPTTAGKADCKKKCDNSNVCFGFIFSTSQGCQYRGGVDALNTRSFFVIPGNVVDFSVYKW